MDTTELKPSKQEQAQYVIDMLKSPGWAIIGTWLTEQRDNCRNTLEDTKDDPRYWQGQIAVYKTIFTKLKGYKDAAKS